MKRPQLKRHHFKLSKNDYTYLYFFVKYLSTLVHYPEFFQQCPNPEKCVVVFNVRVRLIRWPVNSIFLQGNAGNLFY